MNEFLPIAYIKTNCPYSFKFRLFVAEARLADYVQFVILDPDTSSHKKDKADLASKIGRRHTFPVVEVEPDNYLTDSDNLIAHFSKLHGIDLKALPTLQFYRTGLFPTFLEMFHILATPLGWMARLGRKPKAFR